MKKRNKKAVAPTQLIYMGPRLNAFGIGYGNVFVNGLHPRLQEAIELCPSIADLIVPVDQTAIVRKELNFDYAHQMRGTRGTFVTHYLEVQKWLTSHNRKTTQTPTMESIQHA